MKKTWTVAVLIALLPVLAGAATRSDIRKQIEYSMLVQGAIETDVGGNVSAVTVDKPEKFPKGLAEYVQQHVSGWKFEPVLVDGKPMRARSQMSLLVVAKRPDKDTISIRIRNANFDGDGKGPQEGEVLSALQKTPPLYPESVAAAGVSGTVYVVVKVGPDGNVQDAVVEQVNLRALGKEKVMAAWRSALSDSALKAARGWKFKPPTRGGQASASYWSARTPISFMIVGTDPDRYGKWQVHLPGPRQTIPWFNSEAAGVAPDSFADGGVYMLGQNKGPKLLTPLDGT